MDKEILRAFRSSWGESYSRNKFRQYSNGSHILFISGHLNGWINNNNSHLNGSLSHKKGSLNRAGSLNHSDATADTCSEPILKAANLIMNFKSKMGVVSWWVFPKCFPALHCHFDLKIHVLLAALAVAVASAVAVGSTIWFKDPAQH